MRRHPSCNEDGPPTGGFPWILPDHFGATETADGHGRGRRWSTTTISRSPGASPGQSWWSLGSFLSAASLGSVASWASLGSVASAWSILSVGSAGSVLSVGSAGSILSIGSAGSVLSIGAAGSVLSMGGSGRPGAGPKVEGGDALPITRLATLLALAALVAGARPRRP